MTIVFNWKVANRLSKVGSHILMVKEPVPHIPLFKKILSHIPADVMRRQCDDVHLEFVLVEQICNIRGLYKKYRTFGRQKYNYLF